MKEIIFESKFNLLFEQIMLECNQSEQDIITEGKLSKILSSIGLIGSLALAGITFNKSLNKSVNNAVNDTTPKTEQTAQTPTKKAQAQQVQANKITKFGEKYFAKIKQHQEVLQKHERNLFRLKLLYEQTKNPNILEKIDANINKVCDLLESERVSLDDTLTQMEMWIMTENNQVKAELEFLLEDGNKLKEKYDNVIKTLRDAQVQKIIHQYGPK